MINLYTYNDRRKPSQAPPARVSVGVKEGMFRAGGGGADHLILQAGVDYVARHGGGTVTIGAGRYTLRNAVFVPSGVTLAGVGEETILQKQATVRTALAEDLDWYAWRAVVKSTDGLAVGDGITIASRRADGGTAMQVSRHTILGIDGRTLLLDSQPRMNHWVAQEAMLVSTHSLIEARRAEDVEIADLRLEGNRRQADLLDGNDGGAIFLHDCDRARIRNVHIHDFNGDGISWQIAHEVRVENCTLDGMANLGLHPGSGSQRPVMRGNTIQRCAIGIFWCWGVKEGLAEENDISQCARHGISTGRRDTDNLIRRNRIADCGEAAVYFRPERSAAHTSHRVRVEENRIAVPAEPKGAVGIQLCRGVEGVVVRGNAIQVPPGGGERAIVVDPEAVGPTLEENRITEAQGGQRPPGRIKEGKASCSNRVE